MPAPKKEQKRTVLAKKEMLIALELSLGIVTKALKQTNISRSAFYKWIKEDNEFAQAVDNIENITLDFAESKLHEQMRANNIAAIIFYLKTKGKKRGYIERQEVTGKNGENLTSITVRVINAPKH